MPLTDAGLWFNDTSDERPHLREIRRRVRPKSESGLELLIDTDAPDLAARDVSVPHRHPPVKRVIRNERHDQAPVFELGDFDDTFSPIWAQAVPHRHSQRPRLRGHTQDLLIDETASTWIVVGWWAQERQRSRLPLSVRRRDVERAGIADLPPIDAEHTTAHLTQQQPPHRLPPRGRVRLDHAEDAFEILGVPIWASIQEQPQPKQQQRHGPPSRDVFGWPFQTDGTASMIYWLDSLSRPSSRTPQRRTRTPNDARSGTDFTSLVIGPFYVVAGQVCPAGGPVVGGVRAAGED